MTCGIYCIENLINNKKYIGKSYDIEKRWGNHKSQLLNKNHDNDHLQKFWNKYGDEYFNFFIIEECSEEKLIEKEMFYIFYFDAKNNGYNMTDGGDGVPGYIHSEESKIKIGLKHKGKTVSEKTKLKLSLNKIEYLKNNINPSLGKSISEESKKKMSLAKKEKYFGKNNPMYGKKHSEEAKEKISNSRKGKGMGIKFSEERRKKISEAKKKYWENWRLKNGS